MGKLLFTAAIVASAVIAAPASAAVVILATNVDLRSGPATVGVTQTDRFTFSFQPREQFDPSPVLVSTTGNAAVTAFFGAPSVSFTERPTVFGPRLRTHKQDSQSRSGVIHALQLQLQERGVE